MFRYFRLLVYRNKYSFSHLFRVVGSGKSFLSFYFRYTYKPIFGHPILTYECRLCLTIRPIVEPLIVEIRLAMALVRSCIFVRNIAVYNAVFGYRHGLVVGVVELDYVRQGEFSAPVCIVSRHYSSDFFAPPHPLRTLESPQHLARRSKLSKSALVFPLTATLFPLIVGGCF